MVYVAPVREIAFALRHIVGVGQLEGLAQYPEYDDDLIDVILEEAGKFSSEVLAPLNVVGDQQGAILENGVVRASPGFAAAYKQFSEAGWGSLPHDPAYGGQGLPFVLEIGSQIMWQGANLAFGLCPMLTGGAIKALSAHGTDTLKAQYLPKLISGEWTGSMNLTEPQAGSDVGALRAKAVPQADGTYCITGTKIFITWGEHDMTDNIVHLVLARLPGAPAGTRGISLFIVPKFLLNKDGSLGARNDVKCLKLEEKLGIHASPTCVLEFGDSGGATGYLVGEENQGMACMFTMMNSERLFVGAQGVGISEHAFQSALAYAKDRVQGKTSKQSGAIIEHPDVRRMLMRMKALTEASRAICLTNGLAIDLAKAGMSPEERAHAKAMEEIHTPISKAWSTDAALEVTSLGIQVFGGMGFVEETGAAQFYRDARILPIYEGTNGIQAMDLVTRKLNLGGGAPMVNLVEAIVREAEESSSLEDARLTSIGRNVTAGARDLQQAIEYLRKRQNESMEDVLSGAAPFLKLFGGVLGGYYLMKGAMAASSLKEAGGVDAIFMENRILVAQYFAEHILPECRGALSSVTAGAGVFYTTDAENFLL